MSYIATDWKVVEPFKVTEGCTLYCFVCDEVIKTGDKVAFQEVHKCGEHDYDEVIHAACLPKQREIEAQRRAEYEREINRVNNREVTFVVDGREFTLADWLAEYAKRQSVVADVVEEAPVSDEREREVEMEAEYNLAFNVR